MSRFRALGGTIRRESIGIVGIHSLSSLQSVKGQFRGFNPGTLGLGTSTHVLVKVRSRGAIDASASLHTYVYIVYIRGIKHLGVEVPCPC